MAKAELVRARVVRDDCPQCRDALLEEAKSLGGLPLGGDIILIPKHWLEKVCPHGQSELGFQLIETGSSAVTDKAEQMESSETEFRASESKMDATKNIGYPARESGPYGSHPGHDDFDDESGPDGPGSY